MYKIFNSITDTLKPTLAELFGIDDTTPPKYTLKQYENPENDGVQYPALLNISRTQTIHMSPLILREDNEVMLFGKYGENAKFGIYFGDNIIFFKKCCYESTTNSTKMMLPPAFATLWDNTLGHLFKTSSNFTYRALTTIYPIHSQQDFDILFDGEENDHFTANILSKGKDIHVNNNLVLTTVSGILPKNDPNDNSDAMTGITFTSKSINTLIPLDNYWRIFKLKKCAYSNVEQYLGLRKDGSISVLDMDNGEEVVGTYPKPFTTPRIVKRFKYSNSDNASAIFIVNEPMGISGCNQSESGTRIARIIEYRDRDEVKISVSGFVIPMHNIDDVKLGHSPFTHQTYMLTPNQSASSLIAINPQMTDIEARIFISNRKLNEKFDKIATIKGFVVVASDRRAYVYRINGATNIPERIYKIKLNNKNDIITGISATGQIATSIPESDRFSVEGFEIATKFGGIDHFDFYGDRKL